MMKKTRIFLKAGGFLLFSLLTTGNASAQLQGFQLLNEPIDISPDFKDFKNTYYLANKLVSFNPETGQGTLSYARYEYATRMAFNNMMGGLVPVRGNEFPQNEYEVAPELMFTIEFSSPRTIRLRAQSGFEPSCSEESIMLVNGKAPVDQSWEYVETGKGYL